MTTVLAKAKKFLYPNYCITTQEPDTHVHKLHQIVQSTTEYVRHAWRTKSEIMPQKNKTKGGWLRENYNTLAE